MNRKYYVLLSSISGFILVISFSLLIQTSAVVAKTTPPQDQVITAGLAYLQSQQGTDGGIPGFSEGSDPDTTARSVLAFFLAGQPVTGMISTDGITMLDYLATQAISFTHDTSGTLIPGRAGLLLSAVALAGENPSKFGSMDLVTELEACFQLDTGAYSTTAQLGYSSGQASDMSQAWAILGLSLAEKSVPEEANQYLIQSQAADGSWGFGDPDTTALAATSISSPSSSTTTPAIRSPFLRIFFTGVASLSSTPFSFALVAKAFTTASPRPLTTWYVRGASGMLIAASLNSTPCSSSQEMVRLDSSTKALTRRALARQWLYSIILWNASSRL